MYVKIHKVDNATQEYPIHGVFGIVGVQICTFIKILGVGKIF